MRLKLEWLGETWFAETISNSATDDLASLIPVEIELSDFANSEKIGYFPRKLNTANAKSNFDGTPGTLCIYVPWGNLAMFYKAFSPISDLVKLADLEPAALTSLARVPNGTMLTISAAQPR